MPIVSLKLRPTVQADWTPALNESGISSCAAIRFRDGLPQKLGGWTRYYPFSLSGVPRDLHAWEDLNAITHLATATTTQLGVITAGSLQDITPQILVSNFAPDFTTTMGSGVVEINDPNIANVTTLDAVFFDTPISVDGIIIVGTYPIDSITGTTTYTILTTGSGAAGVTSGGAVPQFDTTSGSSTVLVTFPAHGLAVGDRFTFPIATTGGGVTIVGTYKATSVPTADTFEISADLQASSTATFDMNGGDAEITYHINLGPTALGIGYGLGGYGDGGYGTGIVPASQTGNPITTTDWTLDNWGEILLACPAGGGIYYWEPKSGFQNAALVSSGPLFNGGIFVAMPEQILVCWGSTVAIGSQVQQDPLLVKWSDSEDFTNFAVTSLTQAGSFRIPTGSKIMGGLQGPQQALIWTDIDLWAMSYMGPPLVFGFNKISSGCGLIGPHAAAVMRSNVYWMSSGNFFRLSGAGVTELPCSVWDVIFQDLDADNAQKCIAAPNSAFDEIVFYYPSLSGGTGECDKYVKMNTETGSWDYGSFGRSAWTDQSVLGEPIGTTPQGLVFQHETSPDADGQPLVSSFTSGWFVITEGQSFAFVDWFFPDMKWGYFNGAQSASVQVTIEVANYPNQTTKTFGPFAMNSTKDFVNCRLRGRMIRLTFSSSDIGSFWRAGNLRYRVAIDGRR